MLPGFPVPGVPATLAVMRRALLVLGLLMGAAAVASPIAGAQADGKPSSKAPSITDAQAAGHRIWVLLFDISSMSADDAPRAKGVANRWIASSLGTDDLVAVITVGSSLAVLQDFTTNPDRLLAAVSKVAPAPTPPDAAPGLQERDYFNNDLRYRGLRSICTALQPIAQKKAIMFFTAPRERPGSDNQTEVRAATEACNRANASINPIDVTAPR